MKKIEAGSRVLLALGMAVGAAEAQVTQVHAAFNPDAERNRAQRTFQQGTGIYTPEDYAAINSGTATFNDVYLGKLAKEGKLSCDQEKAGIEEAVTIDLAAPGRKQQLQNSIDGSPTWKGMGYTAESFLGEFMTHIAHGQPVTAEALRTIYGAQEPGKTGHETPVNPVWSEFAGFYVVPSEGGPLYYPIRHGPKSTK